MRNLTSPTVDLAIALACGVFCLLYGMLALSHTTNKPFGFVVVFVGVVNLINAWRMRKNIKKENT